MITILTIFTSIGVIIYIVKYLFLNKKEETIIIENELNTSNLDILSSTVINNSFLVLSLINEKTIIKPLQITSDILTGYCYKKNIERAFIITEIKEIEVKENAYSIEYSYYEDGIEKIKEVLKVVEGTPF